MIRINLLPHREEKRKQRKAAFNALLLLSALIGGGIVLMVGGWNANAIAVQDQRNNELKTAIVALDDKIKAIATLKQEIEALKARQQAVEDLQGDRNQPVYLLDELVKQTPAGVYLKAFRQEGQRVTVTGFAQSQERVSELLRNMSSASPWLERPDLVEVKAGSIGQGKTARKVVEFSVIVGIKRPRDKDKPEDDGKAGDKSGTKPQQAAAAAAASNDRAA